MALGNGILTWAKSGSGTTSHAATSSRVKLEVRVKQEDVKPSVSQDVKPTISPDVKPFIPPDVKPSIPPDVKPSIPPDAKPVIVAETSSAVHDKSEPLEPSQDVKPTLSDLIAATSGQGADVEDMEEDEEEDYGEDDVVVAPWGSNRPTQLVDDASSQVEADDDEEVYSEDEQYNGKFSICIKADLSVSECSVARDSSCTRSDRDTIAKPRPHGFVGVSSR